MDPKSSSKSLIPSGGRIAMKILGGVLGDVAVVIAAFGEEVWNRLVADLEGRQFSRAEAARLETALPYALDEMQRCLDEGRTVNEPFREPASGGRTEAEQVLEAGILAAAESHDARKAEYIGRLMGRVTFASRAGFGEVGPAEALFLIRTARELSYRQLVLLALIAERQNRSLFETGQRMVLGPLLMEVDDLYRRALIAQGDSVAMHPVQLEFAELHVTDTGVALYDLMVLSAIDDAHKRETVAALETAFRTP